MGPPNEFLGGTTGPLCREPMDDSDDDDDDDDDAELSVSPISSTQPNPPKDWPNSTQPNPTQPNPWVDPTHGQLCNDDDDGGGGGGGGGDADLSLVLLKHLCKLGLHHCADRLPGADVPERHHRIKSHLGRPHRLEHVVDELANVELDDGDLLPEGHHHGRPELGVVDVERVEVDVLDQLGDANDVADDRFDAVTLASESDHLFTHHRVEVRHRLERSGFIVVIIIITISSYIHCVSKKRATLLWK